MWKWTVAEGLWWKSGIHCSYDQERVNVNLCSAAAAGMWIESIGVSQDKIYTWVLKLIPWNLIRVMRSKVHSGGLELIKNIDFNSIQALKWGNIDFVCSKVSIRFPCSRSRGNLFLTFIDRYEPGIAGISKEVRIRISVNVCRAAGSAYALETQ